MGPDFSKPSFKFIVLEFPKKPIAFRMSNGLATYSPESLLFHLTRIWNLSAHNAILFKVGRGKSDPELRDRLIEGITAQLSKIASDPIAYNIINAALLKIKVSTSDFRETISIL